MSASNDPAQSGAIFEESTVLTLKDLSRMCAVDERHIVEYVEEGVIHAVTVSANEWHFSRPGHDNCTVQVNGPLRVNNASAAMPAVLHGIALALTPSAYVARAVERGLLEHVLAEWSTPPRPVYIVTPPGRARPARVRVLLEFLRAHFAAQPWAVGIDN